jgi:hypothetical protein
VDEDGVLGSDTPGSLLRGGSGGCAVVGDEVLENDTPGSVEEPGVVDARWVEMRYSKTHPGLC